ncbi:MAG TPA: peptide deformylase, partial [Spirochaetia bacterium]
MMPIIKLGDPVLAKHSVVVPDINGDVTALVNEMFEAMDKAKGVGLAAVQVGKLLRIFVTRATGDGPRVFINPDILETSIEMVPMEEGCLSIPGIYTDVVRPSSVRIQAWNLKGRPFSLTADGYLARVIQHEYDHLNGVLFLDRVDP